MSLLLLTLRLCRDLLREVGETDVLELVGLERCDGGMWEDGEEGDQIRSLTRTPPASPTRWSHAGRLHGRGAGSQLANECMSLVAFGLLFGRLGWTGIQRP